MKPFDVIRVEQIARDIIIDSGLAVELVMMVDDGDRWRLVVRDASHRVLDLQISKTDSATTIREHLTVQLKAMSP